MRFRIAIQDGIWILIGHASLLIGMLFSVKMLSESMGPSQYGEFVIGISVAQIFQTFFFGSKFDAIARFGSITKSNEERRAYAQEVYKTLIEATGRCIGVGLILLVLVYVTKGVDCFLIVLASIAYALTSGISGALDGVANATQKRRIVALHQGTESWVKLTLALLLTELLSRSVASAILGYALACLVSVGYLALWFFRYNNITPNFARINFNDDRIISTYTKGFSIIGILPLLQSYTDRWALSAFAASSEVGVYSVAVALGYSPVVALLNLSLQIAVPLVYARAGGTTEISATNATLRCVNNLAAFLMITAAILSVITVIYRVSIVEGLLGDNYRDAAKLLPIFFTAGGLYAVGESKVIFVNAVFKNKLQLYPKIIVSLFGVASAVLLTREFGAIGAASAVLSTSLVYAVWMSHVANIACKSLEEERVLLASVRTRHGKN